MRPIAVVVAVSMLAALAAAPSAAASAGQPLTAEELWSMERVGSPTPSPDGAWIAYGVRTLDREADRLRSDLWRVRPDGSEATRLTWDEAADHSPAWSPDGGHLYFLSSRSGSSQVWRLPTAGGEPEQVTELPLDVASYRLSPDGRLLAVSLDVYVDCPDLACTAERLAAEEESAVDAVAYDRLFVRHWDAWKDGRRSHLFVLPAVPAATGEAAGEEGSAAAPVDVTAGLDADAPSKPFGGSEEYTFTPDSRGVVFTARDAGDGEPWSTDFDLYVVPVDGSAAPRELTAANEAWDTQPVFSPDGRTLAYLAMERPGFEADRLRIVLLDWPGGERRVLTEAWDRSVSSLAFSADGATLYVTAGDLGHVPLFAVDVATGAVEKLVGDGHVREPAVAADGRIVFGRDDLTSPVELYSVAPDGSGLARLTRVNDERLSRLALGEPEQLTFAGWNDETVYAWLVKPAGFEPGKRYPVAFLIHGGPQGSFDNDFHYRWNPQVYAGAGYAALMIDFHGSTGYGQAFTDSITGDWGGKPLVDLQKGLAAALERYPFLDGDRVCALGASYGGYMINWIAGRWSDRFRCLVNHDGLFDLRSFYYTTEELWFPEWEFGGPYWAAEELYEAHNPVNHVESWKTPMLVVQGGLDFRVPETQALATFTALQRRGVPSRLLYFPEENHWVLSPANGIRWHDEVLGWLERWLLTGDGE